MDPVSFLTDDGVRLEGELRKPEGPIRGGVVVAHPHPRHGGSKDHPILWAVRNELAGSRGMAVLLFNFRGVMGSGGSYGGGREEIRDLRAAIGWLGAQVAETTGRGNDPTLVVGWSFGASVALREAFDDPRVGALSLIGLPLRPGDLAIPPLPEASELRILRRPVQLLAGSEDTYCPPLELRAYGEGGGAAVEVEVLEGTDHYLWRREREAAERIGAFADRALFGSGAEG